MPPRPGWRKLAGPGAFAGEPLAALGGASLRLDRQDKLALAILGPIWILCFLLHVSQAASGRLAICGWTVAPAARPGDAPRLSGFAPVFGAEPGALRVGDRIFSAGGRDLRGAGRIGFFSAVQGRAPGPVPVVFERDGTRSQADLPLGRPGVPWWWLVPFPLTCCVMVTLILLRAADRPTARRFFYAGLALSIGFLYFPSGPEPMALAWLGVATASAALAGPLALRAVLRFPPELAPASRWALRWPWVFAVMGPITTSVFLGFPLGPAVGRHGYDVVMPACIAACAVVVARNYRRSGAIGRRRIKWVVLGIGSAAVVSAVAHALVLARPELYRLLFAARLAAVMIPLSFLAAILRFNALDIDRVLSAAASYHVLAAVALGAGFAWVPAAARALEAALGIPPDTAQLALSLSVAAAVVPAHRRLRPWIDRVFFKERHAVDRGMGELLARLADSGDPDTLVQRLGEDLDRLLRPESSVLYARVEESFVPVFERGAALPGAFEGHGALVAALAARRSPLALAGRGRRRERPPLDPPEAAALAALGAEVLVPVHDGQRLAAFLCLGPLRSGDVYTPTDLSLLALVAERVSAELQRFDQGEVLRSTRAREEALRRYVPSAVAAQLASGGPPAAGERDVTVLFVDIRGYTGFSEKRSAEEVFSTVNEYTRAVSEIVRGHGGTIVEFHGDGLLAVFGAPEPLAHKEQAALAAGGRIGAAVGDLAIEGPGGEPQRISVGVGIATGPAFVGSIQSVDRAIWSVLGDTTNLAARLQALTRDLDAVLVVDAATFAERAGDAAGWVFHEGIAIRGREAPRDVWALPRAGDGAAFAP